MAWKKIIKDTKITNLRFHDLRHLCLCIARGNVLRAVPVDRLDRDAHAAFHLRAVVG